MSARPSLLAAARSTPRDSWRWIRWDLPLRVLPLLFLPLLLVALTPLSARTIGFTTAQLGMQIAFAALLGPPFAWLAWWFRWRYVRFVVVPTDADNAVQCLYYVILNTPAEELFFRGLLLGWLQGRIGAPAAWLISTALFGLYHIPAGWGWRAVVGVTAGGGLFGALFLLGPDSGSSVLPMLVHACGTCAFLSLGPWAAFRLEVRRNARLSRQSCRPNM